MCTFFCDRHEYLRERFISDINRWLYLKGYKQGFDYDVLRKVNKVTYKATPGKEEIERLIAMRWQQDGINHGI